MMYQSQLPKAYGAGPSYGRSKGGASAISSLVLVVALVLCGGLSLMLVSTRTQMRDTRLHHEALQEELTYSKNHVQHVEAELAAKTAEYQHLQQEVNDYTAHHSIQELESLRNQKRVSEQTIATTQEEMRKLREELDAAHALIDAYKHHLSDEVASHHQREETWLAVQQDWEKLEAEFQAELDALRAQLNSAHIKVAEPAHAQHHHPQHINAEAVRHDPLLDNLPAPHTPQQQQQQHQQYQYTTPPHVGAPPAQVQAHHVPVPVPTYQAAAADTHTQHNQQHHVPVPAPAHVQTPPHPAEVPHAHHDDHYAATAGHTGGHHDWQHTDTDYGKVFDHHTLYADYPGFVDETQQHDDDGTAHQYHYDAAAATHDGTHAAATGGHHEQQHQEHHWDAAAAVHHDQHWDAGHDDQQHAGHATWQHHDDAAQFHADATHHATDTHGHNTQQQQQHHEQPHAAHQQQQQHHAAAAGHQDAAAAAAAAAGQHHVVDDLAMKLGMGGAPHHGEQPAAAHQYHH